MTAPAGYQHRSVPPMFGRGSNWLGREFVNVEQGIVGAAAAGLAPYFIQSWEVGVTNVGYPWGDIRRYGAIAGVDSTTAWRNALRSVAPAGGVVFADSAAWPVSSQLDFVRDNTHIVLAPGASIPATVAGTENALFFASGLDGVGFFAKNASISGAFPWALAVVGGSDHYVNGGDISGGTVLGALNTGGGVYMQGVEDVLVENLKLHGNGVLGVDITSDIQFNNGGTLATNVTLRNLKCSSTNATINCVIYNPLNCTIDGVKASGARIFNSDVGLGGYGILFYRSGVSPSAVGYSTIINSEAKDTEGAGINTQGEIIGVTYNNCHTLRTCQAQQEVSVSVAGFVHEGPYGKILGCTDEESVKNALILSGWASGTQVDDFTAISPAYDGMVINGALTDIQLSNSLIENMTTPNTLACGSFHQNDYAMERIHLRNINTVGVPRAIFLPALSDACSIMGCIADDLADVTYGAKNDGTNGIAANNWANGAPA